MRAFKTILCASLSILASTSACRPVVAIGWTELAIIVALVILLFSPLLIRLFRFFTRSERGSEDDKD